jgi:hypothetical protein
MKHNMKLYLYHFFVLLCFYFLHRIVLCTISHHFASLFLRFTIASLCFASLLLRFTIASLRIASLLLRFTIASLYYCFALLLLHFALLLLHFALLLLHFASHRFTSLRFTIALLYHYFNRFRFRKKKIENDRKMEER